MARFGRMPDTAALKAPFQSRSAFVDFLRTPQEPEGGRPMVGNSTWSNKDLEPTGPEGRTWTWISLPMFWFSNMFSTTGWNVASALIAVGLTWQQAFISCVLGSLLAAFVVVAMARPGVMYHIAYAVLTRGVMGMYGSFFFIFIRAVICIVWYGIQTFYAANLMSVCLRCVFGHNWENFPNSLPASANVTSGQLLCFFMIWLLELPFMFVHPTKIHHLFTVKGFIMPVTVFGLFGWCMANGTGLQTIDNTNEAAEPASAAMPLGFSIMSGINVIMGTLSPMLVNQPDLARYCQRPRDAGWVQGAAVFFAKILVFFLGMACTVSMQGEWGEAYWNIWDLLDAILDHHWTPAGRTGIFLVALAFILACFATNFGTNSIPFGSDCAGLAPKFFTIRRGQVLCAILGVALVPWELLANAEEFLSFLGSYNIFMAPLCAIIITHYALSLRGNLHVPSLYDGSKTGLYRFWGGVNWVGALSWLCGVSMGLPGLVGEFQNVSQDAQYMYTMGWILTFLTAATVYAVANIFWHPKVFPSGFEALPVTWEGLATPYGRDGFFDGEKESVIVSGNSSVELEEVMVAPDSAKGKEEKSQEV
ncbi:hypothetical protein MBLNU230_g5175t1 [Neophaeotheca triangularis]